jgi:hypothetical protein
LGGDFKGLERRLLRNFRKYAHRDVVERDSLWHSLLLAQHHGLPTRLMSWTYFPVRRAALRDLGCCVLRTGGGDLGGQL